MIGAWVNPLRRSRHIGPRLLALEWFALAVAGWLLTACQATGSATSTSAWTPASTAATVTSSPTSTIASVRPDPNTFTSVAATVTDPEGKTCELCVWLADEEREREQGLMHVTDLGGREAMAFVYTTPQTANFWMKDTVMPLSIAFFDADGTMLDAFDMEPCHSDPCPNYPTPKDFLTAVEVPQGQLARFGIEPGSKLSLSNLPCGAGPG